MTQNASLSRNFAADLLLTKASQWPDRVAARCQGRSLTYAALRVQALALAGLLRDWGQALALAGLLRDRGLAPGQTVLLALPDSFSFQVCFLGCLLAGVTAALLNPRLRREDFAESIRTCGAALVLAPEGHEVLDAAADAGAPGLAVDDGRLPGLLHGVAPAEPRPALEDDVCALFVTSGTTGHPKVVPHTHGDFFVVARSTGGFFGYRPDDVALCSAKMCHAYGMFVSLTLPLSVGACAVLGPDKPDPGRTLDLVLSEGVTILASVPVLYSMLLLLGREKEIAQSRLRLCFSAGEAMHEAVFRDWLANTGQEIWQGYGSTETMTFYVACRPPDIVPGTAGRLLPPFEAGILDEAGHPMEPGTPGQLVVRGGSTMRGYLGDPEWNARAFTRDGFQLTGDMAVENSGVYTILGRMDDMFKAGGLWVSSTRVESALLSHPAVAQAAVTGGTVAAFTLVRAHVVPAPGVAPGPELARELVAHAAATLPDFMCPTDVVFHSSLPLTASGKVQRYKLRQEHPLAPPTAGTDTGERP